MFDRFRTAVEHDFARTHRVADYAAALGYSTRTLTRGVHAAADVARRLGFADPSDFGTFFRRRDGRTPLEFRAAARGTG